MRLVDDNAIIYIGFIIIKNGLRNKMTTHNFRKNPPNMDKMTGLKVFFFTNY